MRMAGGRAVLRWFRERDFLGQLVIAVLATAVIAGTGWAWSQTVGSSAEPDDTTVDDLIVRLEDEGILGHRGEVHVDVYARPDGAGADSWSAEGQVFRPGERVQHMIRFENVGDRVLNTVVVGFNLPDYMQYVDGSTRIRNGNHPGGFAAGNDNIISGGITVGSYSPGAAGYVIFTTELDPLPTYERCGSYGLETLGIVRPAGMNEHYNVSRTQIRVDCPSDGQTGQ